jgi:phage gpG-like protein
MVYKDFPFILKRKDVQATRSRIAKRLTVLALKHFNMSFDREGFVNQTFEAWQPSKRKIDGEGKTLTNRGDLRRSVRHVQTTYPSSRIISDLKYSKRHNEGDDKMPKRQFMGDSVVLNKASLKIIKEEFDKILL